MFRIKSAIDDREREFDDMYCHPESTIPYPILQGKEIQKIIRALGVRACYFGGTTASELS